MPIAVDRKFGISAGGPVIPHVWTCIKHLQPWSSSRDALLHYTLLGGHTAQAMHFHVRLFKLAREGNYRSVLALFTLATEGEPVGETL